MKSLSMGILIDSRKKRSYPQNQVKEGNMNLKDGCQVKEKK